jgi:hypothetical protein
MKIGMNRPNAATVRPKVAIARASIQVFLSRRALETCAEANFAWMTTGLSANISLPTKGINRLAYRSGPNRQAGLVA